ncbi:MAG: mechanosensitive ion channel family protein [Alistipes sp.]
MGILLQTLPSEHIDKLIVPDSIQKARLADTIQQITSLDVEQVLTNLVQQGCWVALKIVLACIIYFLGRWLIRWIIRLMDKAFERRNADVSLRTFLRSLVKVVMMIVVILVVVQTLGINTTSFIALFASAGLAVGMALSGTLQNFAGGVVVLLLRPYRVGDYIVAQGQSGVVDAIGLFMTRIRTTDNRTIYVPNNTISSSIIDNYTQADTRRLSWSLSVSYGDDVDVARAEILKMLQADSRILPEPAPVVYVDALAESSVNLLIRVWVKTSDYWDVYYAVNEQLYKELPKYGINFPFPQMDVHVKQQ